ncbi:hypothetical protein ACROYT_G031440, partial [Oculina patagonica]
TYTETKKRQLETQNYNLKVMENLYKSRSENCLSHVNETLWKTPPLVRRSRWKRILPASLKSKRLLPQVSLLSLSLMNNNFSSLISSQEGDLWLRECALFKRPSWNKKRFVLLEDKLYCYENRKGVLAFSGIVMVSDITSLTLQGTDCIKICNADGSSRVLRCPSEDVRNSWLTALLEAKAANLLKYQ